MGNVVAATRHGTDGVDPGAGTAALAVELEALNFAAGEPQRAQWTAAELALARGIDDARAAELALSIRRRIRHVTRPPPDKETNFRPFRALHPRTPLWWAFDTRNPQDRLACLAVVEIDPRISRWKPLLVPRELSEGDFWANYFSHLYPIRLEVLREANVPVRITESPVPGASSRAIHDVSSPPRSPVSSGLTKASVLEAHVSQTSTAEGSGVQSRARGQVLQLQLAPRTAADAILAVLSTFGSPRAIDVILECLSTTTQIDRDRAQWAALLHPDEWVVLRDTWRPYRPMCRARLCHAEERTYPSTLLASCVPGFQG